MAKRDRSTIFIGKKPIMEYVLVGTMTLNSDEAVAVIKARGQAISKAVDVAEIIKRKFVLHANYEYIHIGTEVLQNARGGRTGVSFIEIRMTRPPVETPAPAPVPAPPK